VLELIILGKTQIHVNIDANGSDSNGKSKVFVLLVQLTPT